MSTLLTTDEVAQRWRCERVAVGDAIRGKKLRATKVAGRWLIDVADLEAYEQARANIQAVAKRTRRPRARGAA
jgi:excisionase family DNA binding protein